MSVPTSAGTVLIVDNDRAVNALLSEVLVGVGLSCESACDGEQALARLRGGGVKVLVTDLDMPNLDGRGLLEELPRLPQPPAAIVISGYVDRDASRALLELPHVRQVLAKPFDVMKFAALVRSLAGSGRVAEQD